jgi:hypothetical protein
LPNIFILSGGNPKVILRLLAFVEVLVIIVAACAKTCPITIPINMDTARAKKNMYFYFEIQLIDYLCIRQIACESKFN